MAKAPTRRRASRRPPRRPLPTGKAPAGHPNLTRAGMGRPPNTPNKVTRAMKEAFRDAFDHLGGVESLVQWAKGEPTEFYKLAARLIPHEIVGPGEEGEHVVSVEHVHVKGDGPTR